MNFLARLMSHGFSIALVVLLAIGFIYRGELFPEWELPDFMVFDSADKRGEDQAAGKIEPAPVQDDRMASATATPGQDVSESIEVGEVPVTMPPVEEVTAPAADAIAESAPVVEDTVSSDAPAAAETETVEEPGAGAVQESAAVTAVTTGAGYAAETPEESQGTAVEKAATPATNPSDAAESVTDSPDAGMTPEPAGHDIEGAAQGDTGAGAPPVAVAIEAPGAEPDSAEVAEVVVIAAPESVEIVEEVAMPDSADAAEESGEPDSVMQDSGPQMPVDSTISSYQLLASAREAFWLRDYQGAEDLYRQMIQKDPDNPDGYGELANMYFSQGNWEAAASAYYEAGTRLVKSGLLAPAAELVDVIRGLDGSQADDLEQEIQMAREASK